MGGRGKDLGFCCSEGRAASAAIAAMASMDSGAGGVYSLRALASEEKGPGKWNSWKAPHRRLQEVPRTILRRARLRRKGPWNHGHIAPTTKHASVFSAWRLGQLIFRPR